VARFTRVCSYDRAGYAWSDPDPQPRSLQRAVDELDALLTNAEVPGPYLLVGHSWGGHIARVFAAQHRHLVAGMVLVDSSHEDRLEVINGQAVRPRRLSRRELEALFVAEMAAMHAGGAPGPDPAPGPSPGPTPAPRPRPIGPPYDRLPADLQALHLWARSKGRVADVSDYQEPLLLVGATRSGGTPPLGDLPLVVLTRGRSEMEDEQGVPAKTLDEDRRQLQADLATLSRRGRQVVAASSGHHIQLEQPRLVVRAIRDVVEEARRP
jgi:pimeloyl-ACP methyl ester carboxylesterase